jgi:hypothetical protein
MVERVKNLTWIQGYLPYLNKHGNDVADIMAITDVNGAEMWVYNYCEAHPIISLTQATEALIDELWPSRIATAPK